jgi:hippurate hydrolase
MIDLIKLRHDLHRDPEIGLHLPRTAQTLAQILDDAGLQITRNIGGSGFVATLNGSNGKPSIALRADMDALPIQEANDGPYKSKTDGLFHGCGHDGHSTMLLGAALQLATRSDLDRTVHFLFQADEETGHGAQAMIDDGLFDRFDIEHVFGLHNMPNMELGQFATQTGPFCAFEDNFDIHITGVGGHASMPEAGIDPIVIGSQIVGQLQTIPSRSVSAKDHAVVSVTEFITDGARNILATNVHLMGDCRGFTDAVSSQIQTRMRTIAEGCAQAFGTKASVEYSTSFRPLVNDEAVTKLAVAAAANVGKVNAEYGRVGFSEDFAAFLQHRPGNFVLMGNGTMGANAWPLHNPQYDFNDDAIAIGIKYWETLALTA